MKTVLIKKLLAVAFSITACQLAFAQAKVIWAIGKADNNAAEQALAPGSYKEFLNKDFGWEDRYFVVGHSTPQKNWSYVLPGPKDRWGGTGPTSGIRSHWANILFSLDKAPVQGKYQLVIDMVDYNRANPPLFKVTVNQTTNEFQLEKGGKSNTIDGDPSTAKEYVLTIPLNANDLKAGGNKIELTTLEGSWIIFDQVKLEGPGGVNLKTSGDLFVREAKPANYEIIQNGKRYQPLLVDVEHLSGKPKVSVRLNNKSVFTTTVETGRYTFEAPMPAVTRATPGKYDILVDGKIVESGTVTRAPCKVITPADYVDTRIGTAHSRWMIAPGPWMPFSMVKLSPDNQNGGGLQAGYDPIYESVGTFSHIHEWTMAGLGMLPVNGPLKTQMGDPRSAPGEGYRSQIDKSTEEAPLGYYKVNLKDYNIKAELTATTRASFQRYTYPKTSDGRIMIDLQIQAENNFSTPEITLKKVSDRRIEGYSSQHADNVWNYIPNDYIVHFVIEFDRPIKKFGTWIDDAVGGGDLIQVKNPKDAGAFVEFDTKVNPVVQVRTGISYVSIEGAAKNLETEISKPFGWSFEKVRDSQARVWNDLFNRLKVSSADRREKIRFYTNMYRAICSRNIFSDVDGKWVDATEKIQQTKDANTLALGCDAFWNTFWNLNQFWNLVTPEWSSRWVKSQLGMYDANGWLAKGPAGMEYIPVMVAEHEVPLIVSAYQMGIRDFDVEKAYEASRKTLNTPAEKVGLGLAGNVDYNAYVKYKYVPYDKGRFSNSLEFSYDDWTLSQFAKSLGKTKDYQEFADRGTWWNNVIDKETGYARLRKSDGTWYPNFDPFQSGRNEHYVEGNAWQLTFFVPQDVPGLAKAIGEDRFKERLNWGFGESNKLRFNAPNDQYWDYPVIQGNQQSMHFAWLFNWVKQPWLTQQWSRAIVDRYYGYGLANAYLGDEDQGQMSSWFIMASLGLFQTDGGCRIDPIYEIGSPIFEKVSINLGGRYGRGKTFDIRAVNVSRQNKFVQSAMLNGRRLDSFWFPASQLLKGGELVLQMGPEPNKNWGLANPPQVAK
jgi:predicted alpha-1,2-mannosidase